MIINKRGHVLFYAPNMFYQARLPENFTILGVGSASENLVDYLQPNLPDFFIDNDHSKVGLFHMGRPILSPTILESQKLCDTVILTTLNYHIAIRQIQDCVFRELFYIIPPSEFLYGFN